jgi:hypothetical protein
MTDSQLSSGIEAKKFQAAGFQGVQGMGHESNVS